MEYYSTEKENKTLLAHEESHPIKTRDDKMIKPPLCQTLSVTSARNYARYDKKRRNALQDLTGGLTDMASTCVRFRLAKKNGGIQ